MSTHGFMVETNVDGVTRRVSIDLLENNTYHVKVCTINDNVESPSPLITELRLSEQGMKLITHAMNVACFDMEQYRHIDDKERNQ